MDKTKKSRLLFVAILVGALLLSVAVGITVATLMQGTEKRVNEFTFGNLTIELTETEWDKLTPADKITYPGREIVKDPKVKNAGETDSYLYLDISIPRDKIQTVNEDQTINAAAETDLFSFTPNSGWTQIGTATVSEDGKYSKYTYAYTANKIAPGDSTPTLFDNVTFVNALEGQPEMDTVLEILVTATGIQSGYLNETGDTLSEKIINAYTISQAQNA